MIESILTSFNLDTQKCVSQPISNGLINSTWMVSQGNQKYILQKINATIFKQPLELAKNIRSIYNYLAQHHPEYYFVGPIASTNGTDIVENENGYYRLFPYVNNSVTINVATAPRQGYEAARQFGLFTQTLSGFDANSLYICIPEFHNLRLRYEQFEAAVKNCKTSRLQESEKEIQLIHKHVSIVERFDKIQKSSQFKKRVTHHDTKISNVLFTPEGKGICVIDLDTVMPGYFISDVGDMMRTYLSPVSEEEKDLTKIEVRSEYFQAIAEGYLKEMSHELTTEEKEHFLYSGYFLIYMQAIRFLADHLNNDVYYGAKYEGHNLLRAQNQLTLLQRMMEKEEELQKIINKLI